MPDDVEFSMVDLQTAAAFWYERRDEVAQRQLAEAAVAFAKALQRNGIESTLKRWYAEDKTKQEG